MSHDIGGEAAKDAARGRPYVGCGVMLLGAAAIIGGFVWTLTLWFHLGRQNFDSREVAASWRWQRDDAGLWMYGGLLVLLVGAAIASPPRSVLRRLAAGLSVVTMVIVAVNWAGSDDPLGRGPVAVTPQAAWAMCSRAASEREALAFVRANRLQESTTQESSMPAWLLSDGSILSISSTECSVAGPIGRSRSFGQPAAR